MAAKMYKSKSLIAKVDHVVPANGISFTVSELQSLLLAEHVAYVFKEGFILVCDEAGYLKQRYLNPWSGAYALSGGDLFGPILLCSYEELGLEKDLIGEENESKN